MEFALGIDIGATSTKVAVVSRKGDIARLETIPTTAGGDPATFIPELLTCAEEVRDWASAAGFETHGAGVAVAGFLDSRRDRLVYNPALQPLVGFPLLDTIRNRLGAPVFLEVDSNAACLAEYHFGAGASARRLLSFCVGTGLGVGVLIDGRLIRIAHECAGDAGHVILQPEGPRCAAGCRGCAESLVSASALEGRGATLSGRRRTAREIIEHANAGDAAAREAIWETGYWLGLAIASLATVFFPDMVVVSGGLSEAGDYLIEPARHAFLSSAAPFCSNGVQVVRAALGSKATVAGAACALWDLTRSRGAAASE